MQQRPFDLTNPIKESGLFPDFKLPPVQKKEEPKKTSILDTIGQVADVLNKPLLPESGTTRQQQSNFIELPGILGDAVGYLTGTGDRKIELPSLAGVYEEAIRPASSITGILTAALGGYEMAKSGTTMGQPTNFAQGIRQRNAQPLLNLPNKYADTTAANWGPEVANFGGMDRPILERPGLVRPGIERPILNIEAAVMAPHEKVAFENIAGQIKPSPIAEAIAQQKKILAEQLKKASKEPESLLEAQQMAEDAFKDFKLPDSLLEKTNAAEITIPKVVSEPIIEPAIAPIIPKNAPPESRMNVMRGAHDPVVVEFDSPIEKQIFSAQKIKNGTLENPSLNKQLTNEIAIKYNVQPYGAGDLTASALMRDFKREVLKLTKAQPKSAESGIVGDLKIKGPSFESFVRSRIPSMSKSPSLLEELIKGESGMARGAKVTPRVAPNELVNKLMNAVFDASPLRNEQEKLYSQERAKRAAAAEAVTTPGMAGHYEALSELKGPLPRVDYEGLKLAPAEVDSLVDMVRTSPHLLPYEKIRAVTGLQKILTGSGVPQRGEISILREVYGDEFGKMMEVHAGIPLNRELVSNVANTMKALRASIDFSAPLRQGLPLIHKAEFWSAARDMFPKAFSEEAFRVSQQELYDRPNYLVGKRAGLQLTDLGNKLSSREEAFGSTIAEKIPALGPLVRGSERAYTGFLNKLRADVFDNLSQKARDVYGKDLTQQQLNDIARFVNNATGRGSLGRFEKIGTELNTVFFSPRLISSRLRILGSPIEYAKADPLVRKEALKSLFAIAGAGAITLGVGKMLGAEVGTNPVSSDFAKNKFGNTRVDPWGGFQQYIVAAARLISGQDDSLSGKSYNLNNPGFAQPSRFSVAENFVKSKLSPLAGLGVTLASNKIDTSDLFEQFISAFLTPHDSFGKPIKLTREVTDQFIPMFYSDMRDIIADDPNNLPLGLTGLFGMGMQTNQPNVKGGKNMISLPGLSNIKIR